MRARAALVLAALVCAGAGVLLASGGSRGEELFHTTQPACVACHNERRGNLAYSTAGPDLIRARIVKGKPGEMPAYRFKDRDLSALVAYCLSLQRRK